MVVDRINYLRQVRKYRQEGRPVFYTDETFVHTSHSAKLSWKSKDCSQGQLLEGVECQIYLYCFTFDDLNLNRALVIIVLFPTKYSNKKVCANDIGE